jgi:hypothetical protein
MRRVMLGIAVAALAALQGSAGTVQAAPSFQCSQRYFTVHEACLKRNNRETCDRVLGERKAACMRTGCWTTSRGKQCGYSRL